MGIDKLNKPVYDDPTDPKLKHELASYEEVTANREDAELVFSIIEDGLEKAGIVLPPDAKILEVGSGTGHLLALLRNNGWDAVGVDARPRHEGDLPVSPDRIEHLTFPDGQFDALIGIAVFDRTMYRQLKPKMLEQMRR